MRALAGRNPEVRRKERESTDKREKRWGDARSRLGPPKKRTSQTPKQKKPEDLRIFSPPLPRGSWCSGITPAQHAGGPGFNPQCVHVGMLCCLPALAGGASQEFDCRGRRAPRQSNAGVLTPLQLISATGVALQSSTGVALSSTDWHWTAVLSGTE